MQIDIVNVDKVYRRLGKREEVRAIEGLHLSIGKGMFGLLGPNGAGKSTLMKMLATLEHPTQGTIRIGDYVLGKDDPHIRRLIGYLPQEFGVYGKLSGIEYLDYVALMKQIGPAQKRKQLVNEMLERVNLGDKRRKRIATYSGGMKQRIGIAQALLGDPQVLIVDEPTAGLDPEERLRFRNLLTELAEDRIVLLSTHIVADIETSCRRLAMMRMGRLVFQGTVHELMDRVEGKLYAGTLEWAAIQALENQYPIISKRKSEHGYDIRVVCEAPPGHGLEAVPPTGMEDGYMLVMREAERDLPSVKNGKAGGR